MPLTLPADMRMGHMTEIADIWKNQQRFDGSRCSRCYYGEYNVVLGALQSPIHHMRFK